MDQRAWRASISCSRPRRASRFSLICLLGAGLVISHADRGRFVPRSLSVHTIERLRHSHRQTAAPCRFAHQKGAFRAASGCRQATVKMKASCSLTRRRRLEEVSDPEKWRARQLGQQSSKHPFDEFVRREVHAIARGWQRGTDLWTRWHRPAHRRGLAPDRLFAEENGRTLTVNLSASSRPGP